ncbi:hypothetical protein E0Z10_g9219 [Xylaria hypoxylon]|uniref:Histone H1 n=1 Tax=Xylaria hypoxylon TaxID=37992 RepID=A0A4Z0YPM8_9PEZI|nr:hypothetical protein E0Z10_g9219 [Xylaria hypoxylon]
MAPPKKTDGAATAAPKAKSTHASYQDMITDAIVAVMLPVSLSPAHRVSDCLKDRTGSSRQSLKKYVKANNTITATDNMFDSLFNKALKAGVDKGVFEQPKGPSGTTKLSKKSKPVAKPAPKKEGEKEVKKVTPKKEKDSAKKATTTKKPAAKKEKEAGEKKPAAKKAAAPPKKAAPKKAPAAKKDAPAVVDKPTTLTKTKSGRVAKTSAKPAAAKKAAAPKKAAPKKEKASKKETKAEAST